MQRKLRSFRPAGTVTGIGSLPHPSASAAIDFVAEFSPEIPFWPQLPQRSEQESIIAQGLGALANLLEPREAGYGYQVRPGRLHEVVDRLHRGAGELAADSAVGFHAFDQAWRDGRFPDATACKGQIEGPITLSAYLFHNDRPFLCDSALFAAVAFHVSQIVCWQVDRLSQSGLLVLLFVDEPALCLDTPSRLHVPVENQLDALAAVLESARLRGAYAGLHCCASQPFERMCEVRPDILSFDAHEGLESFFEDATAKAYLRQGGIVSYGLIPTSSNTGPIDAATVFTRWLQAASSAGDPQDLARRAMVTATCGLGLITPRAAQRSFSAARRVSQLMRKLAGTHQDPG